MEGECRVRVGPRLLRPAQRGKPALPLRPLVPKTQGQGRRTKVPLQVPQACRQVHRGRTRSTGQHPDGCIEPKVQLRRNDMRANASCRIALEHWRVNCDFQVVIDARAMVAYVTKYSTSVHEARAEVGTRQQRLRDGPQEDRRQGPVREREGRPQVHVLQTQVIPQLCQRLIHYILLVNLINAAKPLYMSEVNPVNLFY